MGRAEKKVFFFTDAFPNNIYPVIDINIGEGLPGIVNVQHGPPLHDAVLPLRHQHVRGGQGVRQQDPSLLDARGEGQPGQL